MVLVWFFLIFEQTGLQCMQGRVPLNYYQLVVNYDYAQQSLKLSYFAIQIQNSCNINQPKVVNIRMAELLEQINLRQMQQVWMELTGPSNKCEVIHPHTSCPTEIVIKCLTVVKKSSKLYAVLYLAMFVLQFNKIRREKRLQKSVFSWAKDYVFSLAFMSWLVGGMKTALCILNAGGMPLDIRTMPVLSAIGSTSLFFNDKSRRGEVTYFVFVRACRSAYIYLKKRLHLPIKNQRQLCFIAIFTAISYLYFECDPSLKNRNLLQNLWGQF